MFSLTFALVTCISDVSGGSIRPSLGVAQPFAGASTLLAAGSFERDQAGWLAAVERAESSVAHNNHAIALSTVSRRSP